MPRYFSKFPTLVYTKDGISTLVTDILKRIDVVRGTLDDISIFYEYNIQEGDTPEIVASKYYGDAELHWSVLIFNNMIDPYYDWPLHYQQFNDYIIDKYGSIASAQITNHHYEKVIEKMENSTRTVTTDVIEIDLDTYNSMQSEPFVETLVFQSGGSVTITTSRASITCYDYENELNESKRKIKLIKDDLIIEVKKQFEYLMRT